MNLKTLKNLIKLTRCRGVAGMMQTVWWLAFPPRAKIWPECVVWVRNKHGLEIGGPSPAFRNGLLPVYAEVARLDNCNFAAQTVWEKSLSEGWHFQFDPRKPKGYQYVREAADLPVIADHTYDFILSHHALEHMANPLGAMREWLRILKPDGAMILVVPHKAETFDRRRPVTTLEHLQADFARQTGEDDRTHLEEVLRLHDFNLDWGSESLARLQEMCRQNATYRCVHHHVFVTGLVIQMFDVIGMQVLLAETHVASNIVVVARPAARPDNRAWLAADAAWRLSSPFALDRIPPGTPDLTAR